MEAKIKSKYHAMRKAGYLPKPALGGAKNWQAFEDCGDRVRITAEPEEENYFDVWGEPEGYADIYGRRHTAEQEREEICKTLDRDGCWWIVAEYLGPDGEWHHADSIGMCMGYSDPTDPLQNWYVPDLMSAAVDQFEIAWDEAGAAA